MEEAAIEKIYAKTKFVANRFRLYPEVQPLHALRLYIQLF